jgi:hypothetical protein
LFTRFVHSVFQLFVHSFCKSRRAGFSLLGPVEPIKSGRQAARQPGSQAARQPGSVFCPLTCRSEAASHNVRTAFVEVLDRVASNQRRSAEAHGEALEVRRLPGAREDAEEARALRLCHPRAGPNAQGGERKIARLGLMFFSYVAWRNTFSRVLFSCVICP